jgi:hypothetical protein
MFYAIKFFGDKAIMKAEKLKGGEGFDPQKNL